MKIMSTLESKYGWVISPSLGRLRQLADNRNANEGIRHYVEFSPAEVWADMFNSDGFVDEGKLIGLPVLAADAGHMVDLDLDADGNEIEEDNLSEAESVFSPDSPMSPSRPGRRKSRLQTLRETTSSRSNPPVPTLDPSRTGRLSRSYPYAPTHSPVRSTRSREINIISPSQSPDPSSARRAAPVPRPRRRRVLTHRERDARAVAAATVTRNASHVAALARIAAAKKSTNQSNID